MSRGMTLLVCAAVTVGSASFVAALALTRLDHGTSSSLQLKQGVPTEASVEELRSFAKAYDEAVYWAGLLPSQRLELTETEHGTFVRYLPEGARVGDTRSSHLTVATYAMPRAFTAAAEAARRPGAIERATPGGGIAVWQAARPTSVYLAHAGSDRLVEVFDPDLRRARGLILSGRIRPIRGE